MMGYKIKCPVCGIQKENTQMIKWEGYYFCSQNCINTEKNR